MNKFYKILKKRISLNKLYKKKPNCSEELSEISIPNAVESNDDDTEPTKPNTNYNQSKQSVILKPILENFTKSKSSSNKQLEQVASSREEETENRDEISELESVT